MSEPKVDLNQAGVAELAELPGIGEKLAQKIVDYRQNNQPFSELADLVAVPGISDQMVSELADHLTVKTVEAEPASDPDEAKAEEETKKEAAKEKSSSSQKAGDSEQRTEELRTAARSGDVKKVKALLKKGANGHDKFALLWAAEAGHQQIVVELVQAGADVNIRSAAGGPNALALAAQNGHLEVVQTLIKAGADVDAPAMQGWTPLMKAAYFGHDKIVQSLLEAGASKGARDVQGLTALDYAQQAKNQQAITLLN